MHRDGLLIRCTDQPTANLRAFRKPNPEEKGALIIDLRLLNAMMGEPPRPFELPSMSRLVALLELPKAEDIQAYFTKLAVSDMFWSVLLPPEHSTSFKFEYGVSHTPFLASPLAGRPALAWRWTCWLPNSSSTSLWR